MKYGSLLEQGPIPFINDLLFSIASSICCLTEGTMLHTWKHRRHDESVIKSNGMKYEKSHFARGLLLHR